MKLPSAINTLIACFCLLINPAQAELQSWTITAQSFSSTNNYIAPPFMEPGKSFDITFLIDTLATENNSAVFEGAIKSFTINGITSQSNGIIVNREEFNAIATTPQASRPDEISYISFSTHSAISASNIIASLENFSQVSKNSPISTEITVSFYNGSILARPTSFAVTTIPEPSSLVLMLLGLPLIFIKRKQSNV
jgi:hypothetical protein